MAHEARALRLLQSSEEVQLAKAELLEFLLGAEWRAIPRQEHTNLLDLAAVDEEARVLGLVPVAAIVLDELRVIYEVVVVVVLHAIGARKHTERIGRQSVAVVGVTEIVFAGQMRHLAESLWHRTRLTPTWCAWQVTCAGAVEYTPVSNNFSNTCSK